MIANLLELIPNKLKQQVLDTVVDVVADQAEAVGGQSMAHKIRQLRSDAAFTSAYETGLKKAIERFVNEYELEDEDLVAAVAQNQELFTNKQVQSALLAMVSNPGKYLNAEQDALVQSFDSVLPERKNRERVDKSVAYLLRCLAEEMWHLPELQPIYTLQFARMTAEATREQVALQKAQLAALSSLSDGVRGALLQLTDSIASQKQLSSGSAGQQLPPPKVYHNLPQPDYGEFVGREEELTQIFKLLRPYPQSRHHLIVIDGIGGIGKSSLTLEVAHRCLQASITAKSQQHDEDDSTLLTLLRKTIVERFSEDELRTLCFDMALDYDMLPGQGKGGKARELVAYLDRRQRLEEFIVNIQKSRPDIKFEDLSGEQGHTSLDAEKFDAIIWTSAKNSVLTSEGTLKRQQVIQALDDIYSTIAITLQREDILRARSVEQDEIIRQALASQRVLLIVDNLETVDDQTVLTFLRELPAPTKAIVTTRHRIDVAYPIRLVGMHWEEAQKLIVNESSKKSVSIEPVEARRLYQHTGGLPLAMVWSIAQMGIGYSVESVLRRLAAPTGDVARFCFEVAIKEVKNHSAYKLLLALSIFATGATREALGFVTDLPIFERDDGLVLLEKLSLINKDSNRYHMLPMTLNYSKWELNKDNERERIYRSRWIEFYKNKFLLIDNKYLALSAYRPERINLEALVEWCWENKHLKEVIVVAQNLDFYLWMIGDWNNDIKFLSLAARAANSLGDIAQRADLLRKLAGMHSFQGDLEEAYSLIQQAVILDEESHNREQLVQSITRLSLIQMQRGKAVEARNILEKFLADHPISNFSKHSLIRIWTTLGEVLLDLGDYESAEIALIDARQLRIEEMSRQNLEQSSGLAFTDRLLGTVALEQERYDEAEKRLRSSLEMAERMNGQLEISMAKQQLARLELKLERPLVAKQLCQESIEMLTNLGMKLALEDAQKLLQEIEMTL